MVQSARPESRRVVLYDSVIPGLTLRIEPSGKKTYYIDYERPSNRKRTAYKLGDSALLTVAQARDAAREFLASVVLGDDPAENRRKASRSMTLGSYLERHYGPWVTENRKSGGSTVEMIRSAFASLTETPVSDLTPLAIEEWRTGRRKEKALKSSSLNRQVGALKAALNWGVKHGILSRNPLAGLERLQERDSETKVRYLLDDERERLFAALDAREERLRAERDRYNVWRASHGLQPYPDLRSLPFADYLKPMVIVSLNTGIRRGSLFGLEWRDVDFAGENLTIRAAVSKSGRAYHVPLNRRVLEAFRDWRSQAPESAGGLVFPSPKTGRVMENCDSSWGEVLAEAGIEDFRWHDMRHDFASHLVMRGVDLNTVRELLGHASLAMTLRYAHLAPKAKARAVSLLDD
jgi:integrase